MYGVAAYPQHAYLSGSLISGSDSLTMAERISTMTKANDEECRMFMQYVDG